MSAPILSPLLWVLWVPLSPISPSPRVCPVVGPAPRAVGTVTPELRNPEGFLRGGSASGAPLALEPRGVADVLWLVPTRGEEARERDSFCFGASSAATSSCSSARQTCSCSDRALRRGRSAAGEAAAGAAAALGLEGGNPRVCVHAAPFPAVPAGLGMSVDGSRLDRQQTPPFVPGEPAGRGGRGG